MKKILFVCSLVICAVILATSCTPKGSTDAQLYFVDSSMQRLIPTDFTVDT